MASRKSASGLKTDTSRHVISFWQRCMCSINKSSPHNQPEQQHPEPGLEITTVHRGDAAFYCPFIGTPLWVPLSITKPRWHIFESVVQTIFSISQIILTATLKGRSAGYFRRNLLPLFLRNGFKCWPTNDFLIFKLWPLASRLHPTKLKSVRAHMLSSRSTIGLSSFLGR